MSVLAWWAIPIGATLIAVLVAYLVNRPRRADGARRSVREFQQFRSALEQQTRRPPTNSGE
jgi:hypothetical protein